MNRPITALAAVALALVLVLGGCSSTAHRAEGQIVLAALGGGAGADADADGSSVVSRDLEVTSSPEHLDVVSRDGSVTITVDSAAAGMTIRADLRCRGATPEEASDRLAAARIEVTEEPGQAVRIRPVMPGGWRPGDRANIDVTLPAGATVTARAANGGMRVEGCRGPIDAETTNGSLVFIGTLGDITAVSTNGPIVLMDTVGSIEASSSNGAVEVENHLGSLVLRTSNGPMTIHTHDASTRPVVARSSNGPVDFSVGAGFGGWIQADTTNGRIVLTNPVEGAVGPYFAGTAGVGPQSMRVKLAGDDDASTVRSSNGTVRVTVRR